MVTHERLLELLVYKPETGEFIRRVAGRNKSHGKGTRSGNRQGGYWKVSIDGRGYRAGRLAWFYMTGAWPTEQIDHRDLNSANDRWGNLRLASMAENNRNRRTYRNSTTGFKGVFYDKKHRIYRARIHVNKKITDLGSFSTAVAAAQVREAALRSLHGEFARTA